jgi:hypothetical protein
MPYGYSKANKTFQQSVRQQADARISRQKDGHCTQYRQLLSEKNRLMR